MMPRAGLVPWTGDGGGRTGFHPEQFLGATNMTSKVLVGRAFRLNQFDLCFL